MIWNRLRLILSALTMTGYDMFFLMNDYKEDNDELFRLIGGKPFDRARAEEILRDIPDLDEPVLEELQNPEPESYVEEVLEQIPDGETTLAEMQATELPPETTDPVAVEYTEEGPVLTEAESTEAA